MKAAVSIPDNVFEKAERFARAAGRSRSEVYSSALAEYLARHAPDQVTVTVDEALASIEPKADPFVVAAAARRLQPSEW